MLPIGTILCMPWVLWLAAGGIVYGALVALAQSDMKRLIAYSSVSHLGYCMLGLFALNRLGMQGGTLQMINHGLSTGGLFACVGMIYERYHTREIKQLGGLAKSMPWLAFFFLAFTFSSIGLPGLNGFAGEILILVGMFQRAWSGAPVAYATQFLAIAVLAVLGVVLGAWYMLWLMQRVLFGPPNGHQHTLEGADELPVDLTWRERAALAPLLVMALWIGLVPHHFLEPMAPTLNRLADTAEAQYIEHVQLASERAAMAQYEKQNQPDAQAREAAIPAPAVIGGQSPFSAASNQTTTAFTEKGDGPRPQIERRRPAHSLTATLAGPAHNE
jgi:NADH-quinone oxidoreductase subunit M